MCDSHFLLPLFNWLQVSRWNRGYMRVSLWWSAVFVQSWLTSFSQGVCVCACARVCVCVCVEGGDSSGRAGLGLELYSWASFLWKLESYLSWFYSFRGPVIWYCTLQSWRTNHVLLSCLQHWDDFDGVRHCCQGRSTRKLISGLTQLKLQLGVVSPAFKL